MIEKSSFSYFVHLINLLIIAMLNRVSSFAFCKKEQCHFLTHDYFTIIFLAVQSLTPEQLFVAQGLAMSDFSLTLVLQFKTSKNHLWHGKYKHKMRTFQKCEPNSDIIVSLDIYRHKYTFVMYFG